MISPADLIHVEEVLAREALLIAFVILGELPVCHLDLLVSRPHDAVSGHGPRDRAGSHVPARASRIRCAARKRSAQRCAPRPRSRHSL